MLLVYRCRFDADAWLLPRAATSDCVARHVITRHDDVAAVILMRAAPDRRITMSRCLPPRCHAARCCHAHAALPAMILMLMPDAPRRDDAYARHVTPRACQRASRAARHARSAMKARWRAWARKDDARRLLRMMMLICAAAACSFIIVSDTAHAAWCAPRRARRAFMIWYAARKRRVTLDAVAMICCCRRDSAHYEARRVQRKRYFALLMSLSIWCFDDDDIYAYFDAAAWCAMFYARYLLIISLLIFSLPFSIWCLWYFDIIRRFSAFDFLRVRKDAAIIYIMPRFRWLLLMIISFIDYFDFFTLRFYYRCSLLFYYYYFHNALLVMPWWRHLRYAWLCLMRWYLMPLFALLYDFSWLLCLPCRLLLFVFFDVDFHFDRSRRYWCWCHAYYLMLIILRFRWCRCLILMSIRLMFITLIYFILCRCLIFAFDSSLSPDAWYFLMIWCCCRRAFRYSMLLFILFSMIARAERAADAQDFADDARSERCHDADMLMMFFFFYVFMPWWCWYCLIKMLFFADYFSDYFAFHLIFRLLSSHFRRYVADDAYADVYAHIPRVAVSPIIICLCRYFAFDAAIISTLLFIIFFFFFFFFSLFRCLLMISPCCHYDTLDARRRHWFMIRDDFHYFLIFILIYLLPFSCRHIIYYFIDDTLMLRFFFFRLRHARWLLFSIADYDDDYWCFLPLWWRDIYALSFSIFITDYFFIIRRYFRFHYFIFISRLIDYFRLS